MITTSRMLRTAILGMTLAAAPAAFAGTHYLTIINDDAVPAVRIEAAPTGTSAYEALDTAGPLQGGRAGQATLAFRGGTCVYDLRVAYPDRGPMTVVGWNVCRDTTLRLGEARRKGLRATRQP